MVRVEGLEPPRLAAPEPKSGASTNSATPARRSACPPRAPAGTDRVPLAKDSCRCEGKSIKGKGVRRQENPRHSRHVDVSWKKIPRHNRSEQRHDPGNPPSELRARARGHNRHFR